MRRAWLSFVAAAGFVAAADASTVRAQTREPARIGAAPETATTPGAPGTAAPAHADGETPPSDRRLPASSPPPAPTDAAARPPHDPTARRAWLAARLDELFAAPWLKEAKVSVVVVESDTGKPVYAHDGKALLNAASNVKIVTSAAALALLGPEYRWRTIVYATIGPSGGVLSPGGEIAGDLYVRGYGDPTLTTADLQSMAASLAGLGVKHVRGALVVDEGFFGPTHVGPAFAQKDESAAFRAPSSAVSLNANTVAVTLIPAATAGAPARVILDPPSSYLVTAGRVVTAASGPAAPTVETAADAGGARTLIPLAGRIERGSEPRTLLRRIVDPQLYFAQTFKQVLARRGITIDKGVRAGEVPADGVRIIAAHDSPPLGVVVQELNKRSNNFFAEQIIRTVGAEIGGRPGTWEKGTEAVARWLEGAGLPRGSYRMQNGSGLYDSNRFSAEQIATVLRAALRDFRISSEFLASLALAGADGTIGHRMGGTAAERYVRAKTGTLAGTSCLSGFAGSPGHPPLVFSILMNDIGNPGEARRAQDRAAELLVAYLEAGG